MIFLNEPSALGIKPSTQMAAEEHRGIFYALHHQFNDDTNTGLAG